MIINKKNWCLTYVFYYALTKVKFASRQPIRSSTDGLITLYTDIGTCARFGTLDIPTQFKSKGDYIVNHIFEIITTAKITTLTQLCELQRNQILTITSFAQTNSYMASYPLT